MRKIQRDDDYDYNDYDCDDDNNMFYHVKQKIDFCSFDEKKKFCIYTGSA